MSSRSRVLLAGLALLTSAAALPRPAEAAVQKGKKKRKIVIGITSDANIYREGSTARFDITIARGVPGGFRGVPGSGDRGSGDSVFNSA